MKAIDSNQPTRTGKSLPSIITCEAAGGATTELVAKFSASCERGVTSLAMEAVAARLARDLALPVPEPYFVEIPPEWVDVIPDPERRDKARESAPVAFGSHLITGQFALWNEGTNLLDAAIPVAVAIMAFDGIIQNPDRRAENPNCLVRGDEIRIFDHELAFSHRLTIGWQPPWAVGGLHDLERPGFHIFRRVLRGRGADLRPIHETWSRLTDAQIAEYGACLPPEWSEARPYVQDALSLISEARNRIDDCVAEVKRIIA